jgi:uncharacterized membrane protein
MKRILLTLLGIVFVIAVLAGIGYAGYQIGFRQGARTANGDVSPFVGRPDFTERGFEHGFDRGFPHGGFRMMDRGGFGFFGPFMFLGHIVFWGLILLLAYLLFTRSDWRLTRTEQTVQRTSTNGETVTKIEQQETKNE